MIVYHLRRHSEVAGLIASGLVRATGRQFMFDRWQDAALLLSGLYRQAPDDEDPYVALVIDADEDMIVQSAIPERRLPISLRADDIHQLQEHSYYADVDISSHRLLDVKNGFGDSIISRYRTDDARRPPIWRFLRYAKPYWPFVLGATLCGLIKFLAPLFFPWMLKVLLDDVVLNTRLDALVRERTIRHLVLAVLGVNVVWMFATYYRSVLAAMAGHRLIRDLRVALFSHVQRLSHDFFARHQTGAISSRVVNDISLAQNFVGSALTNVWMDAILLLALIIILASIHPMMTLISLSLMPIYITALRAMGPRIRRSSQEVQQRLEVLSGELHERVAGVSILKGFTRESAETSRFAAQSNKLLRRVLHSVQFTAANEVAVGFVVNTAPLIVVWYGVHEIMAGRLTVGALTQFLLYLGMFYSPLQRLSDLSVVLSNALAAIDRIFEYFDTQPHVAENARPKLLKHCEGRIEFCNVSFGYDADVKILSDISLTILPGQTVAFVGPSGAGKSTMASLIPRFYDPTGGAIKLDGIDLRELSLESLRSHVGIDTSGPSDATEPVSRKLELTPSAAGELQEQLAALLRDKKIHTRNDLSLADLAALLSISTHIASELLNQHLGKSFYEFLNAHRAAEAAMLLADETQNLSMTDVAYEAGFNNPNTFYREFKRHHGMTPTQYRKSHRPRAPQLGGFAPNS